MSPNPPVNRRVLLGSEYANLFTPEQAREQLDKCRRRARSEIVSMGRDAIIGWLAAIESLFAREAISPKDLVRAWDVYVKLLFATGEANDEELFELVLAEPLALLESMISNSTRGSEALPIVAVRGPGGFVELLLRFGPPAAGN